MKQTKGIIISGAYDASNNKVFSAPHFALSTGPSLLRQLKDRCIPSKEACLAFQAGNL